MKIKIIDPAGVHFGGQVLPRDTVIDITKGAHTNAWLRFKQAEEVSERVEEPKAPTPPADAPPPLPPAEPAPPPPAEEEAPTPYGKKRK